MNSWAFYSSGMPGALGWFYKAVKPQLKVWMIINHGTMTAAHILPGFQAGIAPLHIVPRLPHLVWSAEREGYYLQACGTTESTSLSTGIQGEDPLPARWCSASKGCSSALVSGTSLHLAFSARLPFEQPSCTMAVRRSISQTSKISVIRATDL